MVKPIFENFGEWISIVHMEWNIMSFLVLCNFFIGLIILIVELAIISDLQDVRADLYYYSEQKSDDELH